MTTSAFAAGNYRFIPSVFQYSSGIAADPGHHVERITFRKPLPLREGFEAIAALIRASGRPLTAFCACELRSPAPFSDSGFRSFNEAYVETLRAWGLFDGTTNPVARSNVCPEIAPPAEPSFHAFSFVATGDAGAPSFVISGGAEARGGNAPYAERIVRYRDSSAEALRDKAVFVLDAMEQRMAAFGHGWADTTATQLYCVHDIHPFLADEIVRRGAARAGLTWHYNRPPVIGLDYEMDCRSVTVERTA
ncbi:2-amino-5-chloromuconate deaminase CnbZ [Phreatobacter sp. AB_2022a]|uniref:2-amino-5-chloromuconate deaminase CnbZ n=1 Tax=Phreatobacter sp. AB_2022a TaxID=3003134 RepID=UPI002287003D|nr:hypothetical protein [Phreatobacter sp. AB_2022a]MCZ0736682.1 hypothetical protein [Phreatobacter sp. AB_2022a]